MAAIPRVLADHRECVARKPIDFNGSLAFWLENRFVRVADTEAKRLAAKWRNEYKHHRSHSSLKYLPPAAFAATLAVSTVGAGPLPRSGQRHPPRPLSSPNDSHSAWYRKWGQVSRSLMLQTGRVLARDRDSGRLCRWLSAQTNTPAARARGGA